MRKMKKINGYLIVRFNAREIEKWSSTGLGTYGVIDAELYTGQLSVDRLAMKFDTAKTIEEAVDQARSLENEIDIVDQESHITIVKETGAILEETQINIAKVCDMLEESLVSVRDEGDCPDMDERAEAYFRGGFYEALLVLGIMGRDDKRLEAVMDRTWGRNDPPERFRNLPRYLEPIGETIFRTGRQMENCELSGSCSVFVDIFRECVNLDQQINHVKGHAMKILKEALLQGVIELSQMYHRDCDIRKFFRNYSLTQTVDHPGIVGDRR